MDRDSDHLDVYSEVPVYLKIQLKVHKLKTEHTGDKATNLSPTQEDRLIKKLIILKVSVFL